MRKQKISLRTGLSTVIVLCWLAPILLLVLAFAALLEQSYVRSARQETDDAAQFALMQIQTELNNAISDSKSVSYDGVIRSAYRNYRENGNKITLYRSVNDYLRDNFSRSDLYRAVFLVFWDEQINGVYAFGAGESGPALIQDCRAAADEIVSQDAFDQEAMEGICVKAEVRTSTANTDRFSAEHRADVLAVQERIEALSSTRAPLRDAKVRQDAYGELDEAEANFASQMEEAAVSGEYTQEEIDESRKFFAQTMADQRKEVDEMAACRWIVLGERDSASFMQLLTGSENLGSLQMTFALLFIVIGALVIYATVSKMIDEQRSLVGATKALGFYQREIFAKYLTFGVSSTLLGTLAGLLIARFLVEPFILNGYQIYYRADITRPALTVWPTVIVFGAGLLLSVAAVWFACRRLLKTPAVALLQTLTPKGRRKAASGKTQRLSLYPRLILRNIRSDLRRVTVTVVSVAGCCALVVVGFTLRHAVNGAVAHQFTDVVQYDGVFKFNSSTNLTIEPVMDDALQKAGAKACPAATMYATVQVRNLDVEELYCGDLNEIGEMFRLVDAETGAAITPSAEGIYIPKRFSEYFGVRVGDPLNITINATESVTVPVAGVFNNYMNRIMFMSEACYESLFSRQMERNAFLVRLNGADADALDRQFTGMDGYEGYTAADTFRQLFVTATSVMNAVVALFIFMAAVMAGVVLMNLTNIYILQKKRELTVMRVNGFTTRETIDYVLRETVATTALGILLGIGLRAGLGYAIVRILEQPFIQFDRSPSVTSWLIGMGMTVLFTVIVNGIALRKVKTLKLTDVA